MEKINYIKSHISDEIEVKSFDVEKFRDEMIEKINTLENEILLLKNYLGIKID